MKDFFGEEGVGGESIDNEVVAGAVPRVLQLRLPVIDISQYYHEAEHLTPLVDDEVGLEAEESSHGASAVHGYALEHFMAVDALVAVDTFWRGICEIDARALVQLHLLDKD